MRKALIVGIDYYSNCSTLYGCVNDAHNMKSVLERHSDGTTNFVSPRLLTGTGPQDVVTRSQLKDAIKELFSDDSDIALLYFAGHGHVESVGGYLVTSDANAGDDGVSLSEILHLANQSPAKNKVIVLDSCHSGIAGSSGRVAGHADLSEGITILTASTKDQYASESNGSGIFTTLFVDALNGAAANLIGDVTPGSVYAHIDQSLGPWEQRPIFKTNVKTFVSLRKVQPPISIAELQRLPILFPSAGYNFRLDPTYEPEGPNPNSTNTEVFAVLQRFNRVNLLVPVGAPHMYHAAIDSKECKLTVLGEHYRRLAERGLI